ncbi:CAP domain protein [Metarhizium guizhouense ARSEF 977]|uniref:CAP domain protein n=1 Tax=Metarhizium guizhouense (strain ARSEF 977) TaxID=1276136 RepID=A0A0B4GMD5_METGA|nr:CAP domain protein [Metarhizium guizhouense ARSEF 977]KID81247.1 CAP domain protein [Metarhizium guizhouense ARSEF 977]
MRAAFLVAALPFASAMPRGTSGKRSADVAKPQWDGPVYDHKWDGPDYDHEWDGPGYDPKWDGPGYDPKWDGLGYGPKDNGPFHNPEHDGPDLKPSSVKPTQPTLDNADDECINDEPVAPPKQTTLSAPPTIINDTKSTPVPSVAPSLAPPTPSATEVPSGSPNSGYMAIVNKWRATMELGSLKHNTTLESNALQTSSGGTLTHVMNNGTMAQVMAPGNPDNFESVFVGCWLCEMPNFTGIKEKCDVLSKQWKHDQVPPETRHAQYLTSGKYSKIGCGFAAGIWTCDLA